MGQGPRIGRFLVAGRERGGPGWRGGRFTGGGNSSKLINLNLTPRLVIAKCSVKKEKDLVLAANKD